MALRALVAVQLCLLLAAGAATVAGFPVWALVDERAHYDYAQTVAEEGRLPHLERDLISRQAQAIDEGVFPAPPRTDPADRGLAGRSYEAFQPPLYYLVGAPVFLAGGDHLQKVHVLRGLGLALLLAGAWLAWLLARRVFGGDRRAALAGFAVAATFLLWPGVVVRTVTVSNASLEMVLALAALVVLWDAAERRDGRRLVAAGGLVGLALLTRLSAAPLLVPLAAVAILHARRDGWGPALAALALPAVLLAPWVASNLDRYGAPTASAIVRDMQESTLNPTGHRWTVGDLPGRHAVLLNGVLPEEWWAEFLSSAKRRLRDAFVALVVGVPLLLLAIRPPPRRRRALLVLGAPLAAAIGLMSVGTLAGNWDFFYPRYLYAVLPAFGVLAGLAVVHGAGRRPAAGAAAAVTVALVAVWARLATVTPYAP